jgi:glycine/D-amino acid oxidase-like deaminating enzyme
MPMITDQSPIAFADPLPQEIDVAIIGAGIAGTAATFFLAERGVRVLLLEKGRVAGEQSSRNWGWVRQQGRDWAELPIMMEANRIWRDLAARTGEADLAFTQSGCVYLAKGAAEAARFETWYDMARQHQLDTRMLSAGEIREKLPGMGGDWSTGMITETDGRAEPFVAVPALARAAQRAGAAIIEGCAARTLDVQGGRVAGVVTEAGRVRCAQVVLAGGAWSNGFAANTGVDLPQLMVRSTVARTEIAPDTYSSNISQPGLSLRRRADGGYTLATGDIAEHYLSPASFRYAAKFLKLLSMSAKDVRLRLAAPKGFPGAWGTPSRWSGEVVRNIEARLGERYPALKGIRLAEAWAGMIDVTPDAVPVLGEDHRIKGLNFATGLSGHGFGIGPAIGRIMSDLLTGRPPGHDLTRFRPERFSDGSKIVPGPY